MTWKLSPSWYSSGRNEHLATSSHFAGGFFTAVAPLLLISEIINSPQHRIDLRRVWLGIITLSLAKGVVLTWRLSIGLNTIKRIIPLKSHRPVTTFAAPMMTSNSSSPGSAWLMFSLLTVLSWGVYGVFLHKGQIGMADPVNGRYKAFLFVGVAYFITAVLAPLAVLMMNKAAFTFPAKGLWWSLIAGIVGAIGAFGVLLAFGAKGTPAVVMSIVFAGAPVVNAIYSIVEHPPTGGWSAIKWQFYAGIALAALGGCLVTLFKPTPAPPAKAKITAAATAAPASPAGR